MDKPGKLAAMASIDEKVTAIKLAEKKGNGRLLMIKLMLAYRVQQVFRRFKVRYAKRQADLEKQMERALLEETLKMNLGAGPTEEEMMGIRANLDLCIDNYNNPGDVARMKQKANNLSYTKFFLCFMDDIIAWKTKAAASSVEGKVFLVNIQDIGTEKDLFLHFVGNSDSREQIRRCTSSGVTITQIVTNGYKPSLF